jgi:hypothetical protein
MTRLLHTELSNYYKVITFWIINFITCWITKLDKAITCWIIKLDKAITCWIIKLWQSYYMLNYQIMTRLLRTGLSNYDKVVPVHILDYQIVTNLLHTELSNYDKIIPYWNIKLWQNYSILDYQIREDYYKMNYQIFFFHDQYSEFTSFILG